MVDVGSAGHHDPLGVAASPGFVLSSEQRLRKIDDARVGLKAEESSKWTRFAVGWADMPWGMRSS